MFELTYFTGLSVDETAAMLGTSPRTVKRLRQFGRAFLHSEITGESLEGDPADGAAAVEGLEPREVGEP